MSDIRQMSKYVGNARFRDKHYVCNRPRLAVHVLSADYAGETSLVGCKADDVEVVNSPS